MLDGLAEALNESVADAVRDVVGQTVRESVESAVREVLDDPELIRAALARHAPVAAVGRRGRPAAPLAGARRWARRSAGCARWRPGRRPTRPRRWATAGPGRLAKLRDAAGAAQGGGVRAAVAGRLAWRNQGDVRGGAGRRDAVGLLAYLAGPVAASALCGLGGAAASLGRLAARAACRPFAGRA